QIGWPVLVRGVHSPRNGVRVFGADGFKPNPWRTRIVATLRPLLAPMIGILLSMLAATTASASETDMVLPSFDGTSFMGIASRTLLLGGLGVCAAGIIFGLVMYVRLKNMPVHPSMRDVSELIYATCKTYLVTQGKFILMLELCIGTVMVIYF